MSRVGYAVGGACVIPWIMSVSRRRFLETAAPSGLAASAAFGAEEGAMPTRVLGRTGQREPLLGLGCGSRLLMYKDEENGQAALNHALDLGINYVDTAYSEEHTSELQSLR